MLSTDEILSPQALLLHHFQRADVTHENLYVYKQGTPFEVYVTLETAPLTAQDYFELALKTEVEVNQTKIADGEIQEFYQELAADLPTAAVSHQNLLLAIKKAEAVFFMKTKQANKIYHAKLLKIDVEATPKLAQEFLQDMLTEVDAAIEQQGDLIRNAIVTYGNEKRKLEKALESHTLFEKVINFKGTPRSLFVSNLLIDAAMAGHVWSSVVIKAQLREIKLCHGLSIWLPRKLLAHELYKLKVDLEKDHDGFYYRTESPEHAQKIIEVLFSTDKLLL